MKESSVGPAIAARNVVLACVLISSAIGASALLSEPAAAESKDSGGGASDPCTAYLNSCLEDCAGLPPASYVRCHAQCVVRTDACGRSPASTRQTPVPVAKPPERS
jgi:hypothetical protein